MERNSTISESESDVLDNLEEHFTTDNVSQDLENYFTADETNIDKLEEDLEGIEKSLEEFTEKLEEETSSKKDKYLLSYQTEQYLDSATGFSQFLNDGKTITLIGEIHGKKWSCDKFPSMPICDYIVDAIEQDDSNCKVLLEYNINENWMNLGSEQLHNIVQRLINIGKTDKIIPFDERNYFLGRNNHTLLYHSDFNLLFDNEEEKKKWIFFSYVTPFYVKSYKFNINREFFSRDLINLFEKDYRRSLEKDLDALAKHINSAEPKNYTIIQKNLQYIWQRISDFFLLQQLLDNRNTDNYIVLLGDAHYKNLTFLLSQYTRKINSQVSSGKTDCIKIYKPF